MVLVLGCSVHLAPESPEPAYPDRIVHGDCIAQQRLSGEYGAQPRRSCHPVRVEGEKILLREDERAPTGGDDFARRAKAEAQLPVEKRSGADGVDLGESTAQCDPQSTAAQ